MRVLVRIWNKTEEYFLVWSLGVMVAVTFIQVVMRYLFNNSLSWSEELVRYLFIWQIWLGASIGIKNNDHIRIEILTKRLPERGREALEIVINAMLFVFYVFMVTEGFAYLQTVIAKNMTSTGLQIPLAIVYFSLPFGSVIVALRLLCRVVYEVTHFGHLPVQDTSQAKGVD